MINVVQILGDIVAKVSNNLTPTLSALEIDGINRGIENVNYFYGPYKEIIRKLDQWSSSDTYEPKRYPLVALIQPFNESNDDRAGILNIDTLDIAICTLSNSEWDTPTRYDNNFIPILYPIADELLRQIHYDRRFVTVSETLISHTKIDWPFWDAGTGKNPFNDILDVVELKNLKLKINIETC